MTAQALMDGHVASEVAEKAIEVLHALASKRDHARNTNELLPDKPQNVWLNITTKQMTAVHSFKPIKIPVAHPIIDPRTTGICLITKDPQREYKDLLEKNNVKFISRVVGVGKLKGKFKPYEARRMLLKDHGLFLADERVVPLLPKLLGSKWFDAKKQPLPVNLVRKNVKAELERAVSSTYMNRNQGTCTSVKLATLAQTPAQILENLKAALPAIAKHIPGGWDNIQALHIKTNASASLPIWTCSLNDEEGGRWDGMAVAPSDKEDKNAVSDVDMEDVAIEKGKKKRASADDEPGQPRKKSKATKDEVASNKGADAKKSKTKDEPVPVAAPAASVVESTRKKKKTDVAAPSAEARATASTSATASPEGKKNKKAKKQTDVDAPALSTDISVAADGSAPKSSTPQEPAAMPSKKKQRAKAADFFNELTTTATATASAPAAMDELTSKKEKSKLAQPDAVDTAAQLTCGTVHKKHSKHKRHSDPESAQNAAGQEDMPVEEKSEAISASEIKQKRKEGKKEKLVKSKGKSHKDELLGKKIGKA